MRNIPMVDLRGQYEKIKTEVDAAIQSVLNETSYINGPKVKAFQEALELYLDTKHVISCGNGTDALQIAMMALDLQPGDEVITADFTFVATVEVIALLGLTPVLVDVYPDTYTIDIEALEKAITPKTKAIVPVHLFGQSANMEAILDIAHKHNLFVIEDTAQATGAEYTFSDGTVKKVGTLGNFGTTSFFPSKNLGCYGDGGAIFTNDDTLAKKARSIANHGMEVRYYHDDIGVNSRLDSIQAAILEIKLPHLNRYNFNRQQVAKFYNDAFANCKQLITPKTAEYSSHIFHQYTMVLKDADRTALQAHLQEKGIASAIYYPVPLHLQEAYKDTRYPQGAFPVTEMLCQSVLSLPIHTEMEVEDLEYITQSVLEFFQS